MDEFWNDVIAEIERDRIQQIEIHRVIREGDFWNLVDAAMLEPQLGDEEVVGQGVAVNRGDGAKKDGGDDEAG